MGEDQRSPPNISEVRCEDWTSVWWGGMMRNEVDEIFWDDTSGKPLDEGGVREARKEEMGELAKHAVYVKVPVEDCRRVTGKEPIGTRWIDINKEMT